MYRYLIHYKKKGPIRYISHLDLLRTMERAARRVKLPLAFTEGFNPHPKISFAAPLPVGIEGYDEYMDLELAAPMDPAEVVEKLNTNLPRGLDVIEAKLIKRKTPSLMAMVDKAEYVAQARLPAGLSYEKVTSSLAAFLQLPEIPVERKRKKGKTIKDIRPGILSLESQLEGTDLKLKMVLKTGSRENVRPEEVLRELVKGYLPLNVEDFRISRTGLFAGEKNLMQVCNG